MISLADHPPKRRTPFTLRSSSSLQEVNKSPPSSSPPTMAEERELRSELQASVPFPPIKEAKRVVLVRHEQSTWNEEGRIQGSSNFSVLTKKGEAQAETYRQMPIDDSFDVFCSRELWGRARTCWDKILAHESKYVLVVAHNAVNQALQQQLDWEQNTSGFYFRAIVVHRDLLLLLGPDERQVSGSYLFVRDPRRIQRYGSNGWATAAGLGDQLMNMLGDIQAQKAAEMLLDLKVSAIVSSPNNACAEKANIISQVQEAADCLGADCVPRYVEMKKIPDLDVAEIFQPSTSTKAGYLNNILQYDTTDFLSLRPGWSNGLDDGVTSTLQEQSGRTWRSLLTELSDESKEEKVIVAVSHPIAHIALIGHCVNVTKEWLGSFHLDAGRSTGRGVIRCINYIAHLGRWSIPITRSTVDDDTF
ncbi:hypothetical protein F3Y22_tig00111855pilonHSYRG00020 [Hibiscus syriacus]|uniref:2-carboxy-D-arabinitol-1-phosphatase n=1 Tax=Hibiscus syriacus TaxID=106335 RepID=A0A6A2YFA8_HIBSY|nr:hypothetical protein F3Y22_tig00111855pilonHSYRG00020 [Hibiscus syriacus]